MSADAPATQQVDLAPDLAADGAFVGASGLSGTVDAKSWTLVSDLATGEPPRFARVDAANDTAPAQSSQRSALVNQNVSDWRSVGSDPYAVGAVNDVVYSLAVWGGDLYVGGAFADAAGIPTADHVARWDGTSWSGLGSNGAGDGAVNGNVFALTPSASGLLVGGYFSNVAGIATADAVALWDGSSWSALGSNGAGDGALAGGVAAIAVSGTDAYVGGSFANGAGLAAADNVARWDGSSWSALGNNGAGNGALNDEVQALAVSAGNVFVGGYFTDAGGIATADHIASWNGTSWSGLGNNPNNGNGALGAAVLALAVMGTDLYAGGSFTNAGGVLAGDYVARWDGAAWSALGDNGPGVGALQYGVSALVAVGGDLYVAGGFPDAGGAAGADFVARWNGTAWSSLGANGPDGPLGSGAGALAASGSDVYVGGAFFNAAGIPEADHVARWSGTTWFALGHGAPGGVLGNGVTAIAVSGTDLYVGGEFTNAGGIATADYVARWDGATWSAVGDNGVGDGALNNRVSALAVFGAGICVGGWFENAAGIATADHIACWNGTAWYGLGDNHAGDGALNLDVIALAASGTVLYAGGLFTNVAGQPSADYVAAWNGSSWSALGDNGHANGALNAAVGALAVSGGGLFVGGDFTNAAGNASADYVAFWNGAAWSGLGSKGGDGALNGGVRALAVSGGSLFAGGSFTNAAGIASADYVARWNGAAWSALGSDGAGDGAVNRQINSVAISVNALAVSGPYVYVGGNFVDVGGDAAADYVARWSGTAWSALGSDGAGDGAVDGTVYDLAAANTDVFVGGYFTDVAGLAPADNLAAWTATVDTSGPAVPTPDVALKMPQQIGSTASVQVSWSAASDASGIAAYELQYRSGSGRWKGVPLASPTARAATIALPFGHSYQFRLRGTDGVSNTGPWTSTSSTALSRVQEHASQIAYAGQWKRVSLSGASGGYVKKTIQAAARATYSFTGRSIGWISTLGPDRGIAEVWLDGVKVATIDLYAASLQKARLVWTSSTSGFGPHTLEIRVSGTHNSMSSGSRVDLDCLLILN